MQKKIINIHIVGTLLSTTHKDQVKPPFEKKNQKEGYLGVFNRGNINIRKKTHLRKNFAENNRQMKYTLSSSTTRQLHLKLMSRTHYCQN